MKYKCIEGFSVEMFDDDGFTTDDVLDVEPGDVYEVETSGFRVLGVKNSIRLECENGNWLELPQETVDRYFGKVDG